LLGQAASECRKLESSAVIPSMSLPLDWLMHMASGSPREIVEGEWAAQNR
jgi:hypothetical protein